MVAMVQATWQLSAVLGLRCIRASCTSVSPVARVLIPNAIKPKKGRPGTALDIELVEAAGVEPASVSPLPLALHV